MKTILPEHIASITEAEAYLKSLCDNRESYHPEDPAADIVLFSGLPKETTDHMDRLMNEIYQLPGFDPCAFIMGYLKPETPAKPASGIKVLIEVENGCITCVGCNRDISIVIVDKDNTHVGKSPISEVLAADYTAPELFAMYDNSTGAEAEIREGLKRIHF